MRRMGVGFLRECVSVFIHSNLRGETALSQVLSKATQLAYTDEFLPQLLERVGTQPSCSGCGMKLHAGV